ncbi:hypothetical protein OsJ_25730 [Oryza sativa Japonica Group]|uniref:Uncharacterized protein n=1 Tax=Oryza sativa subsp. japonica TaxID=39947 RepID=Q69U63_ORYSJ|nr:hypothetical protein OsJ_25730 [Oryza sativa Japonica Group]BAD33163.1 hypothetical protein [Oryza sativa Japonica Group]
MTVMAPVGRYGGDEGLQIQRQRATERRNHRRPAELSLASADLEGGGRGSKALGRWPGSAEWGGIGESLLFGLGGGKGEGVAVGMQVGSPATRIKTRLLVYFSYGSTKFRRKNEPEVG